LAPDVYVCSKCGELHSVEEFRESRFCRRCGRYLSHQTGATSNLDEEVKDNQREETLPVIEKGWRQLFPYDPYPQQLEFMGDVEKALSQGKVFVAEACNGFGKTVCALSSTLPLGRKIVYATRTHEQVKQVLHEVDRINKKAETEFSAVALASRQNLCLNTTCRHLPQIEAIEACRVLRKTGKCPYKAEFGTMPSSMPLILSPRRMLKMGKVKRICPYFFARKVAERCAVVVAPYQYIFNEEVRARAKLDISGKILIFDEAHNADKVGQDALSDTLSERSLSNAKREIELVGGSSLFIDDLLHHLEKNVSGEPFAKQGSEILRDFTQMLGEDLSSLVDSLMPLVEEIRSYKLGRGEIPVCYLNGVLNFLSLVDKSKGENYVAIYRRSFSNMDLIEYHCLDPSLAIKPVIGEAYAALIMSGTLSPLNLFTEILDLPEAETHTYSAIAKPENVHTFIDASVTTRFQERNTEMVELYGERIAEMIKKVPNGALIFFPQRKMMMDSLETWLKKGLAKSRGEDLFLRGKKVFIEGQRAPENAQIVDEYKETARAPEGAVLFAVFRGRNSEGSNFPYEEARGIFLVGLPYADFHDPLVKAQIQYFDKKKPRLGEVWYLMDAFRAANQAMGRGIRHTDDWCHFFLMDRRYGTNWKFISKWAVTNGIEEAPVD